MTSSVAPEKPTIATLAKHPCQALAYADTVALNVVIEGREITDPDGLACSWGAMGALVDFVAYPTTDKTQDTEVQHLTTELIEGHRALLGQVSHGSSTGYTIFVAAGPGRSFRLTAIGWGPDAPGPDPLTVEKSFAVAIARRLA